MLGQLASLNHFTSAFLNASNRARPMQTATTKTRIQKTDALRLISISLGSGVANHSFASTESTGESSATEYMATLFAIVLTLGIARTALTETKERRNAK